MVRDMTQTGYPDTVPGRVAQIDGDAVAYWAAGYDNNVSEQFVHNRIHEIITDVVQKTGSESYIIHLTGDPTKGRRTEVATILEYQGNRYSKEKPRHLEYARKELMGMTYIESVRYWTDREADDGICMYQFQAIKEGRLDQSVIVTEDKDMRMCPGWHLDIRADEMFCIPLDNTYGSLEMTQKENSEGKVTKKLKGRGTSFFWAQMLMGDKADNIPGVMKLAPEILDKHFPTKSKAIRKPGACGQVKAYELLKDCTNDQEAFKRVREVYQAYWTKDRVTLDKYNVERNLPWQDAFKENACLLWMRMDGEFTYALANLQLTDNLLGELNDGTD